MEKIINETKKYWNQYHDVADLPETDANEKTRTCNVSCVAMITGEHPDEVLQNMFATYGVNNKFQWEELLIKYIKDFGFKCKAITKTAYPNSRIISLKELVKMRDEIKDGNIIFYHKWGHYQLMIGYYIHDEGEISYIFNDPAGDRNLPYRQRKRISGKNVYYSEIKILSEQIYGKCYSIKI